MIHEIWKNCYCFFFQILMKHNEDNTRFINKDTFKKSCSPNLIYFEQMDTWKWNQVFFYFIIEKWSKAYHISSYSFCGNYSFLNLKIQRSQYIRPKVTYIKVRKLFKGGNYMRKYGILILVHTAWHTERLHVFLFEPKRFLLTWEVKYAIGFNR